ncbi:MAG: hypothetical protein AABX51_03690 [Nanoarchaeota archaeon]
MVKGSTVDRNIRDLIRELESKQMQASDILDQAERGIDSANAEREEAYGCLALTYLPELDADAIRNSLRDVQGKVQEIYARRQSRRKELDTLTANQNTERDGLEKKLEDVTAKLNEQSNLRAKIVADIQKELSSDAVYVQLSGEAQQLGQRIEQGKRRVEEAEWESADKLPAYEANTLFSYLLRRQFGTQSYSRNFITRRLDSWVARIVGYAKQKDSYTFLKEMPGMMTEEVKRTEREYESLREKGKELEVKVAVAHGLPPVEKTGSHLLSERQGILEDINTIDRTLSEYATEKKDAESTKGSYHKQAINELTAYLKGEDIANLHQLARKTPGSSDDDLVTRIEGLGEEIEAGKQGAKQARNERDAVAAQLDGVKEIHRRFREKEYDSDDSYFDDGFDINTLLIAYIAGTLSQQNLMRRMESHQDFDDYSSSYSSSSSGGFSSGGGFGGGGFSSGGGFGGGGFSSGKGF